MTQQDIWLNTYMDYYQRHAARLISEYNSADPNSVHAVWRDLMPERPGLACDIGAGSGRDANWLAELGWDVVAVEPCEELRLPAQQDTNPKVSWIDDKLPKLMNLRQVGYRFDLVIINAVWMHLTESQRKQAFRVVSELLTPNGLLVITLRQDMSRTVNAERGFHNVQPEELLQQARQRALNLVTRGQLDDGLGRERVSWDTLCFQLPDDGTGSLPLLRHIIVNDDKSASYKLGLLRTLLRIAEGAPGMVLRRSDDFVEIPFGLVGLFWLKLYMPLLLKHNLMQHGVKDRGYGFAKEDFYALAGESSFDLRIGARLEGKPAATVIGAIRDACANIKQMPAHYISYPGTNRQVFECERETVRKSATAIHLDKSFLSRFGVFRIPAQLWQTMGQYTCWLEPAIVNEWVDLMAGWEVRYSPDVYYRALEWEEGRRDTFEVRRRVEQLRNSGQSLNCTWTNSDITHRDYAVDHCFPWSRWFNNDLWNLVPASVDANATKGDKLPSAALVLDAKPRLLHWWEDAYLEGSMAGRFFMEAESALPLLDEGNRDLVNVFDALMLQRQKLRANQQLVEWSAR